MDNRFDRLKLLIGDEAFEKLRRAKVILFGVGGVGSWCAESLIRSGVEHLAMVDCDVVDLTNINRQLPALSSTVGSDKAETLKKRLKDINPEAEITAVKKFYSPETAGEFNLSEYDYVIDAIDSLSDKALLIVNATKKGEGTRLVSSMGAALKMDCSKIYVAEFWDVKGCPLAAALRHKFRKSGVFPAKKFKCVYSPEIYRNRGNIRSEKEKDDSVVDRSLKKASVNGSIMCTTAIFGLRLSAMVIDGIINS